MAQTLQAVNLFLAVPSIVHCEDDEIINQALLTHNGAVRHERIASLLADKAQS